MEMNFVKLLTFGALFAFVIACGDDSSSSSFANGGGSGAGKNGAENGSGNGVEYDAAAGTVKDLRDGQMYKTVKIGNQVWMAENLNYETADSYCYAHSASYCTKYGRLYTWAVAISACPSGWHLPTKTEWNTLFTAIGGQSVAGTKLKSTSGWHGVHEINNGTYEFYEIGNGTDEFSFSALPAGYRYAYGDHLALGDKAYFWSSTERDYDDFCAFRVLLSYLDGNVDLHDEFKKSGYSVRCLKD
jgi:uncharacterized protein (TIGR02145 family)